MGATVLHGRVLWEEAAPWAWTVRGGGHSVGVDCGRRRPLHGHVLWEEATPWACTVQEEACCRPCLPRQRVSIWLPRGAWYRLFAVRQGGAMMLVPSYFSAWSLLHFLYLQADQFY